MLKVLTIGGATQDVFLLFKGADLMSITQKNHIQNYLLLQSGEKIEIDQIAYHTGGGATNAAVSFSRLGCNVGVFCSIGSDPAGKHVLDDLKSAHIDTSFVHTSAHHPTGSSFIICSLQGERTIFAHRGANSHLELDNLHVSYIKECDQLYITSLSNQSAQLLPSIVATAKKYGKNVAVNPGRSQLSEGAMLLKQSLPYIDTLILNSAEAHQLMITLIQNDSHYKKALECAARQETCGFNLENTKPYLVDAPFPYENLYFSIRNFFKTTLSMGPSIVVVTNGANGVYVATQNTLYFHPSIRVSVTNTVGAGDSFGSCFVASLLMEQRIQEALRNGIVNSASVLTSIGAKSGLLTHDQLKEKMAEHPVSNVQSFTL